MTAAYGVVTPILAADGAPPGRSVATLVLTSLAIMGSPGPSTISLVAAAVAYGTRSAIGYGLGLVAGAVVVLLAVATGVTAVLLAVPVLHWALLATATAYLLWLAVKLATASSAGEPGATARRPSFTGGVVLGVLNPKAWVAIGVVFTSARVAPGTLADAAIKVPLLIGMIVVIHAGWLLAGRLLMPLLRTPAVARAVNVALAAVLVVAALLPFMRS